MRGKVCKVSDKGFGFLKDPTGIEYFFHRTSFHGHWYDMREDFDRKIDIPVEFEEEESSKGPRATNVRRLDWPNQAA